jgi:ribbon-helix-helix CopG family protein
VTTVANQNITLSLPEEDLREARVLAARRGTSVSQLLARMLRETVERETGYDAAKDHSLAILREGIDMGTGGRMMWTRDDLHER